MKRVCVVLALVCALLVPSVARADGLESFTRGLENFAGNGVNEQVTPEKDFIEQYEPQEVVLRSPQTREYDEDSTAVDYVNGTLDSWNNVGWTSGGLSLLNSVTIFLTRNNLLVVAAGLVFMWWGVRKSVRMILGAWRKGHQSV